MKTAWIDSRAARRRRLGHPWVYSNHVRDAEGTPEPGEVVRVCSGAPGKETCHGVAFYNPHSLIALRYLSEEVVDVDAELIARRLAWARRLRERLYPDSNAWRLCHGESDFLPGLVIDRLDDVFVVETFSAGFDRLQDAVCRVLIDSFGARCVVERNESSLRRLEGLPLRRGVLHGPDPGRVEVSCPPVRLLAEPLSGQKTGTYLDQRENRWAAARFARGQRVYDGHCNAGGFGIHAALGGAESVIGVDVSEPALELAAANAALNGVESRCELEQGDVLDDMDGRHRRRERFGLVVVDPPSYTRTKKQVPQARRALRELNRRAMTLVERGGILVTSTCSHHVTEETFLEALTRAANEADRTLRLLERRSQAPDHPVLAVMPESRYLTCVVVEVS